MRHGGLPDPSAVGTLTAAVGQFAGFCGLVASARRSHFADSGEVDHYSGLMAIRVPS